LGVSLIITYRNRKNHLLVFYDWIAELGYLHNHNFEFIIVEQNLKSDIKKIDGIKYLLYENGSTFHKTKLLNLGLNISTKHFVAPLDIDLIPYKSSLITHLKIAKENSNSLITGYRLNINENNYHSINFDLNKKSDFKLSSENSKSALIKNLLYHEKFGIMPFFKRKELLRMNGWNENFIGWGAEDQEIIERYTQQYWLLHTKDVLYIHIEHKLDNRWREEELVLKNRKYYYENRKL